MLAPRVTVDLGGFRASVGKTKALLVHLCEDAADAGSKAGAAEARGKPQSWFKDRTGNLRRSIGTKPAVFTGRTAWGDYHATTPYARFIEYGTRPHVIRARRKPNLIFWWTLRGFLFVGKRVNHPGSYARRFMSDRMTTWWKAEKAGHDSATMSIERLRYVWH